VHKTTKPDIKSLPVSRSVLGKTKKRIPR